MPKDKPRMTEKTILYFESPGKANTDDLLKAVRERAEALGIRQVVVASTHGFTALRAHAALPNARIVAVTISAGYAKEGWTMSEAERGRLQAAQVTVLTCTHALSGDLSEGLQVPGVQAAASKIFYCFSQGRKVAVEVARMAADAGLLDMEHEAIAVGGTGEGADTAIVVKPAFPRSFQELEIREIIAKPRQS